MAKCYLRAVGVLAVRDLDDDLHGAGVLVAEILHPAGDRVPAGPVSDSIPKLGLDGELRLEYVKGYLAFIASMITFGLSFIVGWVKEYAVAIR